MLHISYNTINRDFVHSVVLYIRVCPLRPTHCLLHSGPLGQAGGGSVPEGPVPHHLQDRGGSLEVLHLPELGYDLERAVQPVRGARPEGIGLALIIKRDRALTWMVDFGNITNCLELN